MHESSSTRRRFLGDFSTGLAGVALAAMLHRDGYGADAGWTPPDGLPHFAPRARSVIWLFMNGGVSHLESFDPKPMLDRYAGRTIAETPFRDVQDPERLRLARVVVVNDANGQQRNRILATQVRFRKYGESGADVSDWWPHLAGCVDDLAIVRSLYTTDDNHGAQTQFHSGRHMLDGEFPTLGAWIDYGLGSLNDNLPQFISLGRREYWNARDGHYLGPEHDAVPLRIDPKNPLDYGKPEKDLSKDEQRVNFDLVNRLNKLRALEYPDDPALVARIKAYELAFRMQTSVPEVLAFDKEDEATKKLYGLDDPATRDFGMQM